MNAVSVGDTDRSAGRALAQVEGELLEAERAFADAEARLEAARRERSAALEKINKCQTEFDGIVAERRRKSTPGTRWHGETAVTEELLELDSKAELKNEDNSSDSPAFKVVSGQFERLRTHVNGAEATAS